MKGSIPALLLDKKLAEARKALMSIPASKGQKMVYSALVNAEERIRHLEGQLAATETVRDRIAMQLLPSALACHTEQGDRSDSGSIRRAYELADEVLAVRMQGSAGAPGETTSPENSIRAQEPTEAMIEAACKVCIGFSGDHGTYNDYLDRSVAAEVLTAALNA